MTKDKTVKFLTGKRVYLRPLLKKDASLLLKWVNDPDIHSFFGVYLPSMEIEEEEWIERLHKNKGRNIVLMICLTNGDTPIGTMGLHRINYKDGTATTGARIGEKECWGKGYGTEAKMLLLYHAFNMLNLRKVCSEVFAFNERSRRYNEKCGYITEGVRKREHFVNGEYIDVILMAVFKEDFIPLWEKFKKKHLS